MVKDRKVSEKKRRKMGKKRREGGNKDEEEKVPGKSSYIRGKGK